MAAHLCQIIKFSVPLSFGDRSLVVVTHVDKELMKKDMMVKNRKVRTLIPSEG